jgi:hypothetical protein
MIISKQWFEWLRPFFRTSPDQSSKAIEMLRQSYIEVMQQAALFKHHAQKMHYPQFEKSLLNMVVGKNRRSKWIAEKILMLGGKLPEVAEQRSLDENSWRSLLSVLEEENRSAEHRPEQIWSLESAHPDITQFLQQSYEEEKKYRTEIRKMLMRSDAFALSLV